MKPLILFTFGVAAGGEELGLASAAGDDGAVAFGVAVPVVVADDRSAANAAAEQQHKAATEQLVFRNAFMLFV
jgi:alkanesulfonate monooxygenase SsuD/methylene tetrahydromethanopterin reductase-like flavin-dependent oxidoreductase (luciferase family)